MAWQSPALNWLHTTVRYPVRAMMVIAGLIIVCVTYTAYPTASSSASGVLPQATGDPTNHSPPSKGAITDASGKRYAAVIIEQSFDEILVPMVLHFSAVLPPWWTVVLYTLEEHWQMPSSAVFRRAVADNRVQVQFLPPDTVLMHSRDTSLFLTKPWLWERLQWAERMLLFQADSILCARADKTIDDFVEYDYLGAPIIPFHGEGFNGGLSLRNPSLFLRITQESDFEHSEAKYEDQWFYHEVKARVAQGARIPTEDVAKTFSVETVYYEKPLGYHQAYKFQPDKMGEIEAWCPEIKMVVGRRAVG